MDDFDLLKPADLRPNMMIRVLGHLNKPRWAHVQNISFSKGTGDFRVDIYDWSQALYFGPDDDIEVRKGG